MGTVPSPSTETTGVTTTAAQLNSDVRDATNFLLSTPACTVTTSSNTSIASGTTPVLLSSWASTVVMNDGQWASSPNPSRLTAMTPGLYEISLYLHYSYVSFSGTQVAHCGVALNNAGGAWMTNNGANRLCEDTRPMSTNSGLGTSIDIIIEQFMGVGDYVEAYTAQTSGSSGTIGSGQFSASFSIRWVGSQ